MAQIDPTTDALVGEWLSLPDVAGLLGLPAGRVKQLLRDRKLLAVTRLEGTLAVPAARAKARIDAHLARDPHAEFSRMHIVRSPRDIDGSRVPAFVAAYLSAAFAQRSVG